MSLADDAKLLLIPSAYKSGKVYSVYPINGNGDFTYSRSGDATRVNTGGFIEELGANIPRIDHTGGGCPSLLLEPQRSNLITYSEQLNNANWNKISNASVVANQIISPNGEFTADELVFDGTSFGRAEQTIAVTSGQQYAFSVYLKNKDLSDTTQVWIGLSTTAQGEYVTVTNEWQRFTTIQTANGTNEFPRIQSSENGSIYVWGCQLEENYTSSYIKTESTLITRFKDECFNGGDGNSFNILEGTFFVDLKPYNGGNETRISLSNGTDSQKIVFMFQSNGTQIKVYSSGGVSNFLNLTFDQRNKIAVTFKANEYKFFINGALIGSNTNASVPIGMDRLNFSDATNTSNHFEGEVYDTRVYNKVLTETEAIQLTQV